jgi:hypothetical protein
LDAAEGIAVPDNKHIISKIILSRFNTGRRIGKISHNLEYSSEMKDVYVQ